MTAFPKGDQTPLEEKKSVMESANSVNEFLICLGRALLGDADVMVLACHRMPA